MAKFVATEEDAKLMEYLASFYDDPLGFVMAAYPWEDPLTPLKDETGPDTWQAEYLEELGRQVRACEDGLQEIIQMATASGHGPGKSAMVSWIIHWFLTCFPESHVVVTANTGAQLSDKTWRELAKWQKLAINGHWFDWTATSYRLKDKPNLQYAQAVVWSEHNSEAFAGLHEKYVMTIYDEASSIPDVIWDVTAGSLTTRGAIHLAFGNMTRSSGRFFQCFHKNRNRWTTFSIDCRNAKKANKKLIQEWIDDYGIDSDFVRVRVLGLPPKAANLQYIPTNIVDDALSRKHEPSVYSHAAKVFGVDIAREGDDETVITCRQGLKLLWQKAYHGLSNIDVAQIVAKLEDQENPDAVFIDAVGIGVGAIDYGRQILNRQWVEHKGSYKASRKEYANKRAECWGEMKKWLEDADMSWFEKDDRQLIIDDLIGIEYCFDKLDRLQMERKKDMKERGMHSPDRGDSLAMTFTQKVLPRHAMVDDYDYQEAERFKHRSNQTRNSVTGY